MRWLNYHHLYYFWHIARAGSVTDACRELRLSQPTLSAQLRTLEESLGERLFERDGRALKLTTTGHLVYRYATEIFGLGEELLDVIQGIAREGEPALLRIGLADQISKLIAYRLIEPALTSSSPVRLNCEEDSVGNLLGLLATQRVDVVLSDGPIPSDIKVRAFSHPLGESSVSVVATPTLAKVLRKNFPRSLDGAPLLLPLANTALRRDLDHWFENHDIRPRVVGEFKDGALAKIFGQAGVGAFTVPTAVLKETCRQYGVSAVGILRGIKERYYAISLERKVKHSAVVAIYKNARGLLSTPRNRGT